MRLGERKQRKYGRIEGKKNTGQSIYSVESNERKRNLVVRKRKVIEES